MSESDSNYEDGNTTDETTDETTEEEEQQEIKKPQTQSQTQQALAKKYKRVNALKSTAEFMAGKLIERTKELAQIQRENEKRLNEKKKKNTTDQQDVSMAYIANVIEDELKNHSEGDKEAKQRVNKIVVS